MNKLNKFLYHMIYFVVAILPLTLVACGDDNDDDPEGDSSGGKYSIVGTWDDGDDGYHCFEKNGKYRYVYYYYDDVSEYGTWSLRGDELTITVKYQIDYGEKYEFSEPFKNKYEIKWLSKNKIRATPDYYYDDDDDDYNLIWTRVTK